MKTKTLIVYLNSLDFFLEKIVDENSTEEEIKINLYKFNVYSDLLSVLLTHWIKNEMSYNFNDVSSKVNINMMHILYQTEQEITYRINRYNFTNRGYWGIIRKDLNRYSK